MLKDGHQALLKCLILVDSYKIIFDNYSSFKNH